MKNELFNIIDKYDYISFDVFDTLVYRTVSSPERIFDLIETESYAEDVKVEKGFAKKRILAEQKARIIKSPNDVTLADIYEQTGWDEMRCNLYMNIEIDCELSTCVPNKVLVDILKSCKERGKHVIITTDMYMPRIFFNRLFEKIGVKYDYLFISGEEGPTKRIGGLFEIVLSRLNIQAHELLHIGDNSLNDVAIPQQYGIKTYRVMGVSGNKKVRNYILRKDQDSIIADHLNEQFVYALGKEEESPAFIIGYTLLGPLLYDFCEWLHKKKIQNKIDLLCFIAREGFLLKKCYEIIYPEDDLQLKYARLSKNILRLPSLSDNCNDMDTFLSGLLERKSYTWNMILTKLLVDDKKKFIKDNGLSDLIINLEDEVTRNNLFEDKYKEILVYISELQKEKIDNQCRLFEKYIEKLDFKGKHVGLVNNSFNGSGQKMLMDFFEKNKYETNITGLQFVKTEKCEKKLGEAAIAYLNEKNVSKYQISVFSSLTLIFEHLLFEPCGTGVKLIENGGVTDVICETLRHEKHNHIVVEKIQSYVLQFIKDYSNNYPLHLQQVAISAFVNFLEHPVKDDVMMIGNLWDDDDDRDTQIVNPSSEVPYRDIFRMGFVPKDYWFEGLLSLKDASFFIRFVYNIRKHIRFYGKRPN